MKQNPMWWVFAVLGVCVGAVAAIGVSEWRRPAPVPSARVFSVIDGNTVRLEDRRVVQIAHIRAPALEAPGGLWAKQQLEAVIRDRRVLLLGLTRVHGDTWRATVLIDGERDAGMLMLKAGYARHDAHSHQAEPERELYGFLQEEARQHRRGLWRFGRLQVSCGSDPPPPPAWTIRTVVV